MGKGGGEDYHVFASGYVYKLAGGTIAKKSMK